MSNWKKDTRTPDEDAAELYGMHPDNAHRRIAHADCLRSQVRPRDELIEELLAALAWQLQITADLNNEGMHIEHEFLSDAITKAHAHGYGIKPTEKEG